MRKMRVMVRIRQDVESPHLPYGSIDRDDQEYISDSNTGLEYRLTSRSIISLRYTYAGAGVPCREALHE